MDLCFLRVFYVRLKTQNKVVFYNFKSFKSKISQQYKQIIVYL